jgi:hypothetical protein
MIKDINYIIAKLESIHEDIATLKQQVDNLRHADTGRKAVTRFMIGALAMVGATVGWLVDNAVTVAQNITIKK